MESILSDHKRRSLEKSDDVPLIIKTQGLHLIQISAITKNEKQIGRTDDEDLRIEIDHRKFPQLRNAERYFDSPAAFSGSTSKGLSKIVYFLTWLNAGKHVISLIPDISATFISLDIFYISEKPSLNELMLPLNEVADNGDRRDWVTFVLVDMSLNSFTSEFVLTRRFLDSDDVKVIVDNSIKRNNQSKRQKLWYFIASLIKGENQKETFEVNLPPGLHYIEFWADMMPKFEKITFTKLAFKKAETIQEKIERKAHEFGFDPNMMLRLAKRESQFDPKAESQAGAKGLFQLTDITVKQIKNLGYEVTDPFDIDQNIEGGFVYFNWLFQRYDGQKDHIKKTLAAWNWGLSHIPIEGNLDFENLPTETQNFINDILGDYDF